MKPMGGWSRRTDPEFPTSFEKIESADDISRDEIARTRDGAIDVGLGGQVHDVGNLVSTKNFANRFLIAKIDLLEDVFGMGLGLFKIGEMAGVSKTIEIHQPTDVRLV